MILSDRTIREEITAGRIVIEPYDDACIQPSSVDLHVDREFRVFQNNRYPYIDVMKEKPDLTELVEVDEGESFILHPGEFVLGSTLERVALPDDVDAADVPYGSKGTRSKYQGQRGPTASRFFEEFSGKRSG